MTNLVVNMGRNYCNENIAGAILFREDGVFQIREIGTSSIDTLKITGTIEEPEVEGKTLPVSPTLDNGFMSLSHPKLGYRVAMNGKLLLHLSTVPSFRRGIHPRDLRLEYPAITVLLASKLGVDLRMYNDAYRRSKLIESNNFMSIADGVKLINDGKIATFAVNADLAAAPSVYKGKYLDLLYKSRHIGHIDINGNVSGDITKSKQVMESLNGKPFK